MEPGTFVAGARLCAASVVCCVALAMPSVNFATESEQHVRFQSRDQELKAPLTAVLRQPAGAGPFPVLVLLHGCGGITPRDVEWAGRLISWGYAILQVDSFAARGVKTICPAPAVLTDQRAQDAHAARAYLATVPSIDANRIGLFGWSHGGWVSIEAIRKNDSDAGAQQFRAAVAFYPWCPYSLDTSTPLLVLIGEADKWTPAWRCRDMRIQGASARPDIKTYPDATHGFDHDAPERLAVERYRIAYDKAATEDAIGRVKAFLEKHLR